MLLFRNICLSSFLFFTVFGSSVQGVQQPQMPFVPADLILSQRSVDLGFDPGAYSFLVYDCGNHNIKDAMDILGISYALRDLSNPVSAQDLVDYDILIVGWGAGGETGGLDGSILYEGITGTALLVGHDLDFHTVRQDQYTEHAKKLLAQSIEYVLAGGGVGLIGLTDHVTNYQWLPDEWGISTASSSGEKITSFTQAGKDSGIFDGINPSDLCDWGVSYHNIFTAWGDDFEPFEMGGPNGEYTIAIAARSAGNRINLTKFDDVSGCVNPYTDNTITYSICWNNALDPNGLAPAYTEVVIIDYLSEKVRYPAGFEQVIANPSADPNDPNTSFIIIPADRNYNEQEHTYTWYINTINPGDTNCVTLEVTVKEDVEPGINIYNYAEMYADGLRVGRADWDTSVCCDWPGIDPNIIYVDPAAEGYNNGTSWDNAYNDLRSALYQAGNSTCSPGSGFFTIYAAQGTYSPGPFEDDTFKLPDNVKMYGGFKTGGTDFEYRNPDIYETVLDGMVDPNEIERNNIVVTIGDNTLMDGFTVRDALFYGIYGDGASFLVENCEVVENRQHGIYALNGNVNIKWCKIGKNGWYGIEHTGQGYTINIENSWLNKNKWYGLFTTHSIPTVKNCVVARNGFIDEGYQGIYITLSFNNPVIVNSTFAYNSREAIKMVDNEPNSTAYLDIQNNILWKNNNGHGQISGEDPNFVFYNCIYDANDLDENDYTQNAENNYNFSGNPGFAYNDPNQYDDPSVEFNPHLAFDSPCIDRGSPYLDYIGQSDIDGEKREIVRADIGADEVYSFDGNLSADDIYNQLDRNADGILNYGEFVHFSRAWLTHDPCDPAIYDPNHVPEYDYYNDPNHQLYVDIDGGELDRWDAKCNLADTGPSRYFIDMDDLMIFCRDGYWLWTACWKESQMNRFPRTVPLQTEGGQAMMTAPVPMKSASAEPASAAASAEGIAEIIDFVDAAIAGNPPNADALYDMKIFLEEIIMDLQ